MFEQEWRGGSRSSFFWFCFCFDGGAGWLQQGSCPSWGRRRKRSLPAEGAVGVVWLLWLGQGWSWLSCLGLRLQPGRLHLFHDYFRAIAARREVGTKMSSVGIYVVSVEIAEPTSTLCGWLVCVLLFCEVSDAPAVAPCSVVMLKGILN